jgi:hypothetical protein
MIFGYGNLQTSENNSKANCVKKNRLLKGAAYHL